MQDAILLGGTFDSQPDAWIRTKEEFAAKDQLAVYVNAYRYRLYDVTAEDYPVLKHYLGDATFDALIRDFVNSTQSAHFNIGRYAAMLPEFLARHASGDAIACELAQLENAVSQLVEPQETAPLTPEHLAGMTPERLTESVLYPRIALQLFAFAYPVNDYYIAVKDEKSPLAPEPRQTFVAVFRHEDTVWRMALGAQEYALLMKLFSGMPIGEALSSLQNELGLPEEELGAQLSGWFSRWIRNGLLRYNESRVESLERNVA
jgi:hypothetical protein